MKYRILDEKLKQNFLKYILQCTLATLTILAVLFFLDILTETAIITSLGASAFIIFTMPKMYSSHPRRLIGGYIVGLSVGIICFLILNFEEYFFIDEKTMLILFGAISVGFSIFLMAITNTEHAPAAGIALGLVINEWNIMTIFFIIGAILWMASVRIVLKKYLMNLTSPKDYNKEI